MILQRMFSGQPSKPKNVKVSAADNKKLNELYDKWNKSGKQEDAEAYMNLWTEKVYIPHRKAGILVDPDMRIAHAAYDSAPLKVEKNFSEEKNEKAAKVGKEIGMVGGSLGVGALGGLGVHKLAKDAFHNRLDWSTKADNRLSKHLLKQVKKGKLTMKDAAIRYNTVRDVRNGVGRIIQPWEHTRKISEFARTKKGKLALIGGTAAALGSAAYIEAKKKGRKEK